MRLIGLVTFMPVNLQLVSEGINGCFTEELLTPPPRVISVCRVPLPQVDNRFFRGHLHSKALFLEKQVI